VPKPAWRTSEVRVLREHYPKGGASACAQHLERSLNAIALKARALGLQAPHSDGWRPALQLTAQQSEMIDEAVRRSPLPSALCAQLAARAQMHMPTFVRHVRERGGEMLPPTSPPRPWTAAESALLVEYSEHPTWRLQALLVERLGAQRSAGSINNRRVELGLTRRIDRGGYTARELARCLGVPRQRVSRWVQARQLAARRYQCSDPHRSAGGGNTGWVITDAAVRKMLRAQPVLLAGVRRTAVRVWLADVLGELKEVRQGRSGYDGAQDASVVLDEVA
jgi:hypothetical protein